MESSVVLKSSTISENRTASLPKSPPGYISRTLPPPSAYFLTTLLTIVRSSSGFGVQSNIRISTLSRIFWLRLSRELQGISISSRRRKMLSPSSCSPKLNRAISMSVESLLHCISANRKTEIISDKTIREIITGFTHNMINKDKWYKS